MANSSLLAAFMAETALITYRDYAGGGIQVGRNAPLNLPLPASYTAPVVFFGALALVPQAGQQVAGLVGWGIVVATLLNLWDPTGKVKAQGAAAKAGPPPPEVSQGQAPLSVNAATSGTNNA